MFGLSSTASGRPNSLSTYFKPGSQIQEYYYDDDLFLSGYTPIWGNRGPIAADSSRYPTDSKWVTDNLRTYPEVYSRNWFDIDYMSNNITNEDMSWAVNSFKY